MTRAFILTAAVVASAAACGGSSSGGQPAGGGPVQHPSSLVGTVGKNDAFTISLTDDKGAPISNVAAGTYQLTVHDDSGIHNFHVQGSGVNDATVIAKAEVKTYSLTLTPGTYTFLCDSHPTTMKGSFKVS